MLNSLFYLIPLLRLISPAAAAPAVGEQIPPAGQIRLFTEGKLVGDAALTFNIGGVPRGQTFLRFERKGPNSFLLVDYSATQRAQRDNGAVLEGLEAGEGAFSLHKRSDDKDEHLDCDLDGDFKDPSKGVYWAFTWDEVGDFKTEICAEEYNGITLKCKDTDGSTFKPRCTRY